MVYKTIQRTLWFQEQHRQSLIKELIGEEVLQFPSILIVGQIGDKDSLSFDDFKFFNKALTQQDVSHYCYLSLPAPTPPTPPTLPTLHWDFKTFYDSNRAVEFTNPFDIQIVDDKAIIDQTGIN
jgi:hypothetical protein